VVPVIRDHQRVVSTRSAAVGSIASNGHARRGPRIFGIGAGEEQHTQFGGAVNEFDVFPNAEFRQVGNNLRGTAGD
jgi:hypothetical protein